MHRAETTHECCSDGPCDSGLRNHYFEGKRLTADSFRVEQDYLVERRHLLNRAIHGWGVVFGYALKSRNGQLEIAPGLALDECGRELLLGKARTLGIDDVLMLDARGKRLEKLSEQHRQSGWLLSVHYAEQGVGTVKVKDPCSCERREWEHICETVRFSLRPIDRHECCQPPECELQCGCGTGHCCEQHRDDPRHRHPAQNPVHRGGCQCICDHICGLADVDCAGLCLVEEPCGPVRVDLRHGVPLACVELREGECNDWVFADWIESCGPRRLVKRNDTLFDLIRGCDLTRIAAISWAAWHRTDDPVHWNDFARSFGDETAPESGRNRTKYWIEFSRPVRRQTVRPDCFTMTVSIPEGGEGWGEPRRVPILDVETVDAPAPLSEYVTRATLIVDAGWVDDAIESRKKYFNQSGSLVEIEVRGDFILDCNGQAVDANAVGLSPAPTGNGTPGGTFYSSFRVQPRDGQRPHGSDNPYRAQGE